LYLSGAIRARLSAERTAGGDGAQHAVARLVAIAIIDQLEAIEVNEQGGNRRAGVARMATKGLFHAVIEEPSIGRIGQTVETGMTRQFAALAQGQIDAKSALLRVKRWRLLAERRSLGESFERGLIVVGYTNNGNNQLD